MNALLGGLRRFVLPFVLAVAAPVAGLAACADLDAITTAQLDGTPVETVQTGLRRALQDENPRLRDGLLGSYTRQAMVRLCETVPRFEDGEDVPGTVALTREYAALTDLMPEWREVLSDRPLADLMLEQIATGEVTLPLRLAGTPMMTVQVLSDQRASFPCAGAEAAIADASTAAEGAALLEQLYGLTSAAQVCALLPVAGEAADFTGALARLNRIEAGLPGALQDLRGQGFARWILGNPDSYRLRLTGTEPAVWDLIREYRAVQGGTVLPPAEAETGEETGEAIVTGPCTADRTERTLTYYALSQDDIDSLAYFVNLSPIFQQFREQNPGFDSRDALWQALREVLAPVLDACILETVGQIVADPRDLALEFHLDAERTDNLIVNPLVQPVVPVLQEFTDIRTQTEEELATGIRAALTVDRGKAVEAEVQEAAETMAASAEPEAIFYDVAPEGVEVPEVPPTVPRVVVTGATDDALADSITNEQILKVLAETVFAPATSPELIESQVRGALRGVAAAQTAEQVDDLMQQIEPAIVSGWSLTPELEDAILGVPYIAAAVDDPSARNLPERMASLAGIAYPSYRLFEAALDQVPLAEGWVGDGPLSEFVSDRITMKAQRIVTEPEEPRDYGALQVQDCRCVSSRLPYAEVYGFYPFWEAPLLSPPPAETVEAEEGAEAEAGETAAAAEAPRNRVNFEIVSRLAFYGLEFAFDQPGAAPATRRVLLRNEVQWSDAKRDFVNTAHRYRAKADVAFDLRDWRAWSDANIDEVVAEISAQMAPFKRFQGYDLEQIDAALPTLFDSVQPDGVTLIFHGYEGQGLAPQDMEKMTRLILEVYESLPNRKNLSINLAFDFALFGEQLNQPLFDDLYELLIESSYVIREEGWRPDDGGQSGQGARQRETVKIVDKILLFLERPTTETKKELRYRMERGVFKGESRAGVLRSIIPVIPPGANRNVLHNVSAGAEQPGDYSQLEDDVVYFKDNFGGIGFWPAPLLSTDDPVAAEDTRRVEAILTAKLDDDPLPAVLASFRGPVESVCGFTCPRRGYVGLGAILLFVTILALTWRSFYSGIVDRIAFRTLMIGAVWIGNIVLIGALALLSGCDPVSVWPQVFLFLLLAALGLILLYNFVQRVQNGPKP
ncbi:hypothetical protein [Paracoccus marinaquae]|uniref:Uncharacterized protein n=1 Tax=Paracoccus marinaquae TaxID=2841926 RepID=A0ABS6AHQ4_9RHOB|nr:hypothetical protein [Paracoccus marinaquae]MBU3030128.1 hypothetical protein [Paracoccus marinaquae]